MFIQGEKHTYICFPFSAKKKYIYIYIILKFIQLVANKLTIYVLFIY